MSTPEGEARRARLGEHAVDAARQEARQAPTPGPGLFEYFAVRFGWRAVPDRDAGSDVA